MSSEPPTSAPTDSDSDHRTVLGSIVHVLALVTGIFGPGIVYVVTDNEFARENARNALNWHIPLTSIPVILLALSFVGSDAFVIVGALFVVFGGFLTMAFSVIAVIKAIRGEAWMYPFVPELI